MEAAGGASPSDRRLARERAARREAETIAEHVLSAQYETINDLTASRAVLDETPDFVAITDATGHASYVNRALRELLGLHVDEADRVTLKALLTSQSYERFVEVAMPAVQAKGVWRGELALTRRDGGTMPVSQVIIGHRGPSDELLRLSFIARDVTEQRDHAELLAHRALHDELTGLPNRRLFFDRLDMGLARAARTQQLLGVLFIDVDGFKAINDTLGHEAGDRVLVAVGDRLSQCMRASDTLARLGGDEFIVLCENLSDERSALEIAGRLIAATAEPISVANTVVTTSVSIGIAIASGTGTGADELVHAADTLMYEAKKAGKGTSRLTSLP
jgi:diguanylate cyclase (GGDEF)-like protein/PAS domain S-box-containing protein